MHLLAISDTHGAYPTIPPCDLLVHTGDFSSGTGTLKETAQFARWLEESPAKNVILVPGNHDLLFARDFDHIKPFFKRTTILMHESAIVQGFKVFGSPWQPKFGTGWAFNMERDQLKKKWAEIPDDTEILCTHSPPAGILDFVHEYRQSVGCEALTERLHQLKRLRLHTFGHIHESSGSLLVNYVDRSYWACNSSYVPGRFRTNLARYDFRAFNL